MQSINRRLKILEQHRAMGGSDFCAACHSYIGGRPTDIKIVPNGTPQCPACGQPHKVKLNLGRKILADAATANMNNDAEIQTFIEQLREMTEH